MNNRSKRLLLAAFAALIPMLVTGCYTRLTTAKETREWRDSYPEIEDKEIVVLPIARENLGNAFVMPVETYLDAAARFNHNNDGTVDPNSITGEVFRFRPGSRIQLSLPGHPESSVNAVYVVTPEGTIDAGPIADLQIAGLTRHEIRDALGEKLTKYLKPVMDPDSKKISVSVSLPLARGTISGESIHLGKVSVLSLTGSNNNELSLTGDDTLMTVLARGGYPTNVAWNEIAIYRTVRTKQKDPTTGLFREFTVVIICDLEEIIYENPNLNLRIRDGDIIYLHPEKAPWIVEMVNTMQVVTSVYSDFKGVENVFEDIFGSN